MNSIEAVSFGNSSDDLELKTLLIGHDWDVTFSKGRDFLLRQERRKATVILVLLCRYALPTMEERELLLESLSRTSPFASICLIGGSPDDIDTEFYSNFDEFIFWPCSRKELYARVSRFTQGTMSAQGGNVHARILEDFAAMNLLGESRLFVRLLEFIKKIARCDATVLIEGETGTGKENAARAIHYLSDRRDNAFIPVNCGAIPDNLLESELFGHQKGAFTDARITQPGLVEMASGGTLLLDEVDTLSPKAQAALLRFLQTCEYRPLGGRRLKHADVRVVAATNADLRQEVEKGDFRKDLLFRLNVLSVYIPPLRDRPEDIGVIANSLLAKYASKYETRTKALHPKSLEWLCSQYWSGNIRELENVLLREFLLAEGPLIKCGPGSRLAMPDRPDRDNASDALSLGQKPAGFHKAKEAAIHAFEIEYVIKVLEMASGNVTEAARIAGTERRAFGKLIKKYNVDKAGYQNPRFRDASA